VKLWLISLGLFFFLGVGFTDGDVCVASFFLETAAEIIVATVDRTGSAFTYHKIMTVRGFDFVTANVAADGISNSNCFLREYLL